MACGGWGFCSLLLSGSSEPRAAGQRLAYLFVLDDCTLQFWELWNESLWDLMDGDLLSTLNRKLQSQEITLQRLIRSPSGVIRARRYDTSELELVGVGGELVSIGSRVIPKTFRLSVYTGPPTDWDQIENWEVRDWERLLQVRYDPDGTGLRPLRPSQSCSLRDLPSYVV